MSAMRRKGAVGCGMLMLSWLGCERGVLAQPSPSPSPSPSPQPSPSPSPSPQPSPSPIKRESNEGGVERVSLATESVRAAWQQSGIRLGLGVSYGWIAGLRGAPSGRLLGGVLRIGMRLDQDWSVVGEFQYASASASKGLSALRFAGTIDPVWHVSPSLAVEVGVGFGGFVEGNTTGRVDVDPLPSTLDASYTFPDARTPLPSCNGAGAVGLGRVEWSRALGSRTATTVAIEVLGQYTRCVDPTGRVEPDTARAIVRTQYWPHAAAAVSWGFTWR
jgi:hypothetical protein